MNKCSFLLLAALQSSVHAQDGTAALQRMHDRYAGTWYQSLTFIQTTIITRAGAKPDTATWWEALKGRRLRIDFGAPTSGNLAIATPDSQYTFREGALARAGTNGNPFIPLIMGVYLQPVEQTAKELKPFGFDLSRAYRTKWQGKKVTVVGASAATDTTSAQFWIDEGRQVVVRVRGALLGQSNVDILLAGYVKLGKGWLATDIDIQLGAIKQTEKYRDWRADVPIDDAFFTVEGWKSPHWAKPPS